jgi:hypothetical protein
VSFGFWPQLTFDSLTADPADLSGAFEAPVGAQDEATVTLINYGNVNAVWSSSITYHSGSDWLSLDPAGGTVGLGVSNTQEITATATCPGTEGLYEATITISYADGAKSFDIPADLNCRPGDTVDTVAIRTCCNRLNVQQVGRVAVQDSLAGFTWFADSSAFLFDGSLILGTSRDNLNFDIFHELLETGPGDNPFKPLYALSDVDYDSSTYLEYRIATGVGCTHDSTIEYTFTCWAAKHPGYGDFYTLKFDIYPGSSFTDPISDLVIAYACDWNVPSDTDYDNSGGVLEDQQTLYQRGQYPGGEYEDFYGALVYLGGSGGRLEADGGFVWENDVFVYPDDGYHVDSLWKYLRATTGWSATDSIEDLSSILVVDGDAVLGTKDDTISFYIDLGAYRGERAKQPDWLLRLMARIVCWICDYVNIPFICPGGACRPGECDGNGIYNVSDCVAIIGYIFGGGPPCVPYEICSCDWDCNCMCNVSDAVYCIAYIFGGGPPPCTCAEWVYRCGLPLRK